MRNQHWVIKKIYSILHNYYKEKQLSYFVTKELIRFFLKKELVFVNKKDLVSNEIYSKIKDVLIKITKLNMPYQYAFKTTPFIDTTIYVEPPVFIPRPETEEWVYFMQRSLASIKHNTLSIADFCSGTGCIGISLLTFFSQSYCTAFDINRQAIALAAKNATKNSVRNRYTIYQKDLCKLKKCKKYDIIIGNPPYISFEDYLKLDRSVKNWECRRALTDEREGYTMVLDLLKIAKKRIHQNGVIGFEICHSYSDFLLEETKKMYPKDEVFLWSDQYHKKRSIIIAKGYFINFFKNKVYKKNEL